MYEIYDISMDSPYTDKTKEQIVPLNTKRRMENKSVVLTSIIT